MQSPRCRCVCQGIVAQPPCPRWWPTTPTCLPACLPVPPPLQSAASSTSSGSLASGAMGRTATMTSAAARMMALAAATNTQMQRRRSSHSDGILLPANLRADHVCILPPLQPNVTPLSLCSFLCAASLPAQFPLMLPLSPAALLPLLLALLLHSCSLLVLMHSFHVVFSNAITRSKKTPHERGCPEQTESLTGSWRGAGHSRVGRAGMAKPLAGWLAGAWHSTASEPLK